MRTCSIVHVRLGSIAVDRDEQMKPTTEDQPKKLDNEIARRSAEHDLLYGAEKLCEAAERGEHGAFERLIAIAKLIALYEFLDAAIEFCSAAEDFNTAPVSDCEFEVLDSRFQIPDA